MSPGSATFLRVGIAACTLWVVLFGGFCFWGSMYLFTFAPALGGLYGGQTTAAELSGSAYVFWGIGLLGVFLIVLPKKKQASYWAFAVAWIACFWFFMLCTLNVFVYCSDGGQFAGQKQYPTQEQFMSHASGPLKAFYSGLFRLLSGDVHGGAVYAYSGLWATVSAILLLAIIWLLKRLSGSADTQEKQVFDSSVQRSRKERILRGVLCLVLGASQIFLALWTTSALACVRSQIPEGYGNGPFVGTGIPILVLPYIAVLLMWCAIYPARDELRRYAFPLLWCFSGELYVALLYLPFWLSAREATDMSSIAGTGGEGAVGLPGVLANLCVGILRFLGAGESWTDLLMYCMGWGAVTAFAIWAVGELLVFVLRFQRTG